LITVEYARRMEERRKLRSKPIFMAFISYGYANTLHSMIRLLFLFNSNVRFVSLSSIIFQHFTHVHAINAAAAHLKTATSSSQFSHFKPMKITLNLSNFRAHAKRFFSCTSIKKAHKFSKLVPCENIFMNLELVEAKCF
jgi:hypothetical protein